MDVCMWAYSADACWSRVRLECMRLYVFLNANPNAYTHAYGITKPNELNKKEEEITNIRFVQCQQLHASPLPIAFVKFRPTTTLWLIQFTLDKCCFSFVVVVVVVAVYRIVWCVSSVLDSLIRSLRVCKRFSNTVNFCLTWKIDGKSACIGKYLKLIRINCLAMNHLHVIALEIIAKKCDLIRNEWPYGPRYNCLWHTNANARTVWFLSKLSSVSCMLCNCVRFYLQSQK